MSDKLDIDKKYDPSPEENRAAIACIQAEIDKTFCSLSDAIVSKEKNEFFVNATASLGATTHRRITVARFSSNFIGDEKAKAFAEEFAAKINLSPVGT